MCVFFMKALYSNSQIPLRNTKRGTILPFTQMRFLRVAKNCHQTFVLFVLHFSALTMVQVLL